MTPQQLSASRSAHRSLSVTRRDILILAGIIIVAALLGGRGLTDEGSLSLQGDMARYLMNGVFLYDFLLSGEFWSVDGALQYAQHYYARYPALSLGHHPPLLPVAIVPFYALFGVSVASARALLVVFFALAVVFLYFATRRLYDRTVASWAALLFATSPIAVRYGQQVLSEMPMLAVLLGATAALLRFCDTGRSRDFALFVVAAALTLYAKQLAIFVFPAFAALLFARAGWRRLVSLHILLLTVLGGILVAPIIVMTFVLSPFNVEVVREIASEGAGIKSLPMISSSLFDVHMTPALLFAAIAGLVVSVLRRDGRIAVGLLWLVTSLLSIVILTGPIEPARYAFVAVPAYFLCAASLAAGARSKGSRIAVSAILGVTLVLQLAVSARMTPTRAAGYEQVALEVLDGPPTPTVLYSSSVDTGYFMFFVRKHSPQRNFVILRADKVLTTSMMADPSVEDRIETREEIYPLLDRYGTRIVVIEDRPSGSDVLDWLREEVRTSRFRELQRIPLVSEDTRLRDVSMLIYEYLDAKPPQLDTEVDIQLPLIRREIRFRLSELIGPGPD